MTLSLLILRIALPIFKTPNPAFYQIHHNKFIPRYFSS
jgi:hypothetical protein